MTSPRATSCTRGVTSSLSAMIYYFLVLVIVNSVKCMDNLNVAFQWKQIDFNFPSENARQEAVANREFIQENNIPVGLEVYGDRLFITVPRWKIGVPASLTYIKLNDSKESPVLNPYPNWSAHKLPSSGYSEPPEIVSPFRVRADKCGRLWVLDTGVVDILGNFTVLSPTQLLIYDLHNDALLRRYAIPKEQTKEESFFANIAVEDETCDNAFAYLGDLGGPGLVVYSWRQQISWKVKHHYFHIDPLAGDFNVNGVKFQWPDGLFGLALSAPGSDGFSTLYFHPMSSTNEFSVSTKFLRNETLAMRSFHQFKSLGSRGPNGQSSVSFLDKDTGVLFYALANLNAIACWRTSIPSYTIESQGRIYMSNVTMVFPNDIKVDMNGNLWVLSDKLPRYMYSELDKNEINFRILTATVKDAIRGTACDSKLIVPNNVIGRTGTVSTGNNKSKPQSSDGVSLSSHFLVPLICTYLLLVRKI